MRENPATSRNHGDRIADSCAKTARICNAAPICFSLIQFTSVREKAGSRARPQRARVAAMPTTARVERKTMLGSRKAANGLDGQEAHEPYSSKVSTGQTEHMSS